MDDMLRFASRDYCLMALLLAFSRSMDLISTRVATPNLVLEGNPIAKFLGWNGGIISSLLISVGLAFWPVTAIAISTMSLLVAARNFQSAWLMRSMGEEHYRDWHVARIQETPITLYLLCLAGNVLLTAAVGFGLIFFSKNMMIPQAIGLGIITYAVAVAYFTLLSLWRMRRAAARTQKRRLETSGLLINGVAFKPSLADSCACETSDLPGK